MYSSPPEKGSAGELPAAVPGGIEKDGETVTRFGLKRSCRDSYLELVRVFPLASVKSDEHLQESSERDGPASCQGPAEPRQMYLDALSDLVAAYEDQHHAIGPASGCRHASTPHGSQGVTQAIAPRHSRFRSPRFPKFWRAGGRSAGYQSASSPVTSKWMPAFWQLTCDSISG